MNSRISRNARLTNAWKIALVGGASVLVLWFAYGQLKLDRPVEKWGVFGDKFGALNTLFTGLALVGLLATLVHQHDEIQSSKEDIERVVQALTNTTRMLSEQNQQARLHAYITALVARIEGYNRQQDLATGRAVAPGNLGKEQHSLFVELDLALNNARASVNPNGMREES